MILVYRQTSESIKYLYSEPTQVSVFVLDNVVMCLCCQFPRYIVRAASTGLVQSQHEPDHELRLRREGAGAELSCCL